MSTRPARKLIRTAKLTADNAGELKLASHRRAIASAKASASAPLTAPQLNSSSFLSSSPLPPSSPPPPTDTEDASSSVAEMSVARISSKRPSYNPIKSSRSHDSIMTVSSSASNDIPDAALAPKLKRPKLTVSPGHQEPEVPIINIDDIEDEQLNKSDPTADIKYFFTKVPHVPGQVKRRLRCNLCA